MLTLSVLLNEQILVFALIFTVSHFLFGRWKRSVSGNLRRRRYPPSIPSLPLIGSLPFLRKFDDISQFFLEKSQQIGHLFTFRAGSKLVLVINSKDLFEEAMAKNARSFSARPEMTVEKNTNPKRKGIAVTSASPEWKRGKQVVLSIMKEFGFGVKNLMEERISVEVEAIVGYIDKKEGQSFDPKELSALTSSNIIMNILFGRRRDYDLGLSDFAHEVERFAHLLDMIYDIAPFVKYIPMYRKRLSEMDDCGKKMSQYIKGELEMCLQNPDKSCFVTSYVEQESQNHDREQLIFILRDLIAAGTDTTAITIRWMLVVLANYPEIQKKLQKEIDSVISRERLPRLQDQPRLPYVEATTLELFRWRTVLPMALPHETSSDSIVAGYFVPSGTLVMPNIHAAHHDPVVWGDPEVFRPERFLDKSHDVVGRDRVITFSLGRRSCLGETLARCEIFLIFASIAQMFTVLPPEGLERVSEKFELPVSTAKLPEPFSIRLTKRQ